MGNSTNFKELSQEDDNITSPRGITSESGSSNEDVEDIVKVQEEEEEFEEKWFGPFMVVFVAICNGTVSLFIHSISSTPAWKLVCMRAAIESVYAFTGLNIARSFFGQTELSYLGPKPLRPILFVRGMIYFAFSQMWWLALEWLPVGVATVTIYATPGIVAPIFAKLLLGESMHWSFPILFILNFAGVICITQPGFLFHDVEDSDPVNLHGILVCTIASVLAVSVYPVTRKAKEAHVFQIEFTTGMSAVCLFAPVLILVMFLVDGGLSLQNLHIPEVIGIATLQFISVAMQSWSTKYTRALVASLLMYVEIPYSLFMQRIVFNNSLDGVQWIGTGCIAISVVFNAYFNLCQKQDEVKGDPHLLTKQHTIQNSDE